MRDILYVFQGIDGKNIKMSSTENCYKVDAKVCSQNLRQRSETESTQLLSSALPEAGQIGRVPNKLHSLIWLLALTVCG